MSDLDSLFAEYVEEHRAGGVADPVPFLARASPDDRRELGALIDAYLTRTPRRQVGAATLRDSLAERTVDDLERVLGGRGGLWPALLPRLRERAGIKRSELVQRLAAALGVGDKTEKVSVYYHQMELGLLAEKGVSERVLEVLGSLVGENATALREAGRAVQPHGESAPAAAAAFARRAYPDAELASPGTTIESSETGEWDEVDELFRGG